MAAVFGRRVAQPPAGFDAEPRPSNDARKIIVPENAYRSESPAELVQAVVNFVNFALRQAYFNRDEIAQNAMRAYHVDFYLAQVNNGGHAQFAANSNMLDVILKDVGEGLDAMRHEAAGIYKRFLTFAKAEPARMAKVLKGGGFGDVDPFMDGIDKEFYALNAKAPLVNANRDWLMTLPELQVVPDSEYIAVTDAFAATNRQAEQRKAEREQAAREADLKDPLKRAMIYLCMMVEEPRRFIAWHQGQQGHDLGDGVKVVRFVVETDKGMCSAFFHPQVSLLVDNSEFGKNEPIAKIPTEMVVAHVLQQTGRSLMEVLERGG
jgi:hypothetical protein